MDHFFFHSLSGFFLEGRGQQQAILFDNRGEKCDVTFPWLQNFWMTTIGSFCNGDGEQQKNNRFRLAKKQLCMCIKLFCAFLSSCCMTAT